MSLLAAVCLLTFLHYAGAQMRGPILPLFAAAHGATATGVGFIVAATHGADMMRGEGAMEGRLLGTPAGAKEWPPVCCWSLSRFCATSWLSVPFPARGGLGTGGLPPARRPGEDRP
jgi:hypothetical protein